MRTTLTIAVDILRELKALAHDRRAGPSRPRRRYREDVADLGEPHVNLDRALAIAARLEDDETLRKLEQRK